MGKLVTSSKWVTYIEQIKNLIWCIAWRTSLVRGMSVFASSSSTSSIAEVGRRNRCRMPTVLSWGRDRYPRNRPQSLVLLQRSRKRNVRLSSIGRPWIRNGAEGRRWYGADINPLLMKYPKSGEKILDIWTYRKGWYKLMCISSGPKIQGRIHGYPSRVRVGRGHIWCH